MADEPQKPTNTDPAKPKRHFLALCSAGIDSALEQWPVLKPWWKYLKEGAVEVKKGWPLVVVIALGVAIATWWIAGWRMDLRIEKIQFDNSATNSFSRGEVTSVSNQVNRLQMQIDDNRHDADAKLAQAKQDSEAQFARLTTDFNESKRERDTKIEQLTIQSGNLQSRLDYYLAMSSNAVNTYSAIAGLSNLAPYIHEQAETVVSQLQAAGKMFQDATSGGSKSSLKWSITEEQAQKMKSILAPLTGTKIDIATPMGDHDGADFANKIFEIFTAAGWLVGREVIMDMGGSAWRNISLQISGKDVSEELKARLFKEGGHISVKPTDVPIKAAIVAIALKDGPNIMCHYELDEKMASGEMKLRIGSPE